MARENAKSSDRQQEQSFSQAGHGDNGQKRRPPTINLAASALRGLGQLYDMQAATTRIMLRAQVRAASTFGLPDYSRLFEIGDDRAQHLFSAATENLVHIVDQEEELLNEVPSQVSRLIEKQVIDATERWKYGLQALQHQASESIEELRELSHWQAEELAHASESFNEAAQTSIRESGEHFRAAARQGTEAMGRQTETMRKEGEQMSGKFQQETEESGERMREGSEHAQESSGKTGRAHKGSGEHAQEGSERSSRTRTTA